MKELGSDHLQKVLTIAGSDSLAGGGLQADLKTFEELNVFGFSVTTSIASIYPNRVDIEVLDSELVLQQIQSVLSQTELSAVKIGLLGSVKIIEEILNQIKFQSALLVVDPVLVFKEGEVANNQAYLEILKSKLLPLAFLTTPNLTEAEELSGMSINSPEEMVEAAKIIQSLGCPNVVIKGGNRLKGLQAVDYLLTEQQEYWLSSPKISTTITNGAGCTFSAAITAYLAQNRTVYESVKLAKKFVSEAISKGISIGDSGSVYQGAFRQGKEL